MDTSGHWVHLPLLSAELPEGWKVGESAAFVAPSGRTIWVTVGRVDDGDDAESLLARDLDAIRSEFGEPVQQSASTRRWRGDGVVSSTTLRFEDAHIRVLGRVVAGDLAMHVTGAWAVDDDDGNVELETLLGGIRLLSRPSFEPEPVDGSPALTPAPDRSAIAPEIWAEMHHTWSSGPVRDPGPSSRTVWSVDELATIATVLGAASFPTVGSDLLAMLPDGALHAVLGTTMRSLTARGVVEIGSDGSAVLDGSTAATMDVALFPDLAISVQSRDVDGISAMTYFGVRPDDAVRIEVAENGARRCGHVDPHGIADAMMSLIGDGRHDDSGREPVQLSADALAERWKAMDAAWQISSTWRDGHVVGGRVLYAARDADGHCWITEPDDDDTWTVRPVSLTEVRHEIVECLPGAS